MSVAALVLSTLALAATPERFAVIVGVNTPISEGVSELAFADDDAVLTERLLRGAGIDTALFVHLDDDSKTLFAKAPIRAEPKRAAVLGAFDRAFEGLARAKAEGRPTELYFFYSGHGDVEDGEGFVALADGRLSRTDLFEQILARSPADKNHVVIDACRSYFLVFPKGPGGRRAPHSLDVMSPDQFPNTGFVLSTSSDRDSHEWSRFRAGVFSHEVRSALYGGADIDRDGTISYAELGAFITVANGAIPNPRFRPDAIVRAPKVDDDARASAMFAWPASDRVRVDVPPEASLGHVYLEDAVGVRLADAHPSDGETLRLYAPASRPLFLRGVRVRREYAIEGESPLVLAMNDAQDATVSEKGAVHLAFRELFGKPVTAADVDAFAAQQRIEVTVPRADDAWTVRSVAPWVAGGSAVAGVGLWLGAAAVRSAAEDGTGAERERANSQVSAMQTGAVVGLSVAVVAAATWTVLELLEE